MVVKILSSYLYDTASFRDVFNFYQGNFIKNLGWHHTEPKYMIEMEAKLFIKLAI